MRQVQKHALILAGIFLLWYAAQAAIKPSQGTGRIIEDFKEIPLHTERWSGIEGEFDEETKLSLPHCALLTRDYEDDKGYDSNLSIVYGVDLGDFHQPEVCMEGQGWRRLSSRQFTLDNPSKPHPAMLVTMQDDYQKIVVVYWFASQGNSTTALGSHKAQAFIDRIKKNELKPSAMIRLITPVVSDIETAERVTLDLAVTMDPYINKTLAKPPVFEDTGTGLLEE